jgi:hypothetical protein
VNCTPTLYHGLNVATQPGRENMPKASQEDIGKALAAAVSAAEACDLGTVQSLHVDVQDSGELPYRVVVLEEELPIPGVATIPSLRNPEATASRAERSLGGSTR